MAEQDPNAHLAAGLPSTAANAGSDLPLPSSNELASNLGDQTTSRLLQRHGSSDVESQKKKRTSVEMQLRLAGSPLFFAGAIVSMTGVVLMVIQLVQSLDSKDVQPAAPGWIPRAVLEYGFSGVLLLGGLALFVLRVLVRPFPLVSTTVGFALYLAFVIIGIFAYPLAVLGAGILQVVLLGAFYRGIQAARVIEEERKQAAPPLAHT